jgi:diphthine-ammonia ligase
MKLGILFSGGKDSAYALQLASAHAEVSCLITLISHNKESYMFHTPAIEMTRLQAEACGLPHVVVETEGEKEVELEDLEKALKQAQEEHGIQGVVTGAIESVYQGTRVQTICHKLGLWCFNPLWKKDQVTLLEELVEHDYEVLISGVFAYPFDDSWLGRRLDETMIGELVELHQKYQINPSGEGGELETTVLDAPFFNKRIEIVEASGTVHNHAGSLNISEARLVDKEEVAQ